MYMAGIYMLPDWLNKLYYIYEKFASLFKSSSQHILNGHTISSLWIWKGVSATLQSGR